MPSKGACGCCGAAGQEAAASTGLPAPALVLLLAVTWQQEQELQQAVCKRGRVVRPLPFCLPAHHQSASCGRLPVGTAARATSCMHLTNFRPARPAANCPTSLPPSCCRREVWCSGVPHSQVVPPRQGLRARGVSHALLPASAACLRCLPPLPASAACSAACLPPPCVGIWAPTSADTCSPICATTQPSYSLVLLQQRSPLSFCRCLPGCLPACSYTGGRSADDFLKFIEAKIAADAGFARVDSMVPVAKVGGVRGGWVGGWVGGYH